MVRASIKRQRGGMLFAAICGLIVVALTVFAAYALSQAQRRLGLDTGVETQLDRIDSALAQFVAVHRRLPCPAQAATNPGRESLNSGTGQCVPADQAGGLVPWLDLGLPEADTIDPWLGRISYRVQPSLASNLMTLMNMSWCDSAGATSGASGAALPCTSPCAGAACTHPSNYLYGKGLQVQDAGAAWLNQPSPAWDGSPATIPGATGAAYVLVSHGPNGAGENSNSNSAALTGATIFVDAARTASFDDVLRHPTLATVLAKASLGARTPH